MTLTDDQLGRELETVLRDRARAVAGHPVAVSTIARRSRAARRRRTTAAAGVGALVGVGATLLLARAAAGPGDVGTATGPPAPAGPSPTIGPGSPAMTGTPLRMGLDLPGAQVVSALDASNLPSPPEPAEPLPFAGSRRYAEEGGSRWLVVSAGPWGPGGDVLVPGLPVPVGPEGGTVPPAGNPASIEPGAQEVVLADGTEAVLVRYGHLGPTVTFLRDGYLVSLEAKGLDDDTVLAAAANVRLDPAAEALELVAGPDGFAPSPLMGLPELRPQALGTVDYQLPDGTQVSIHVERAAPEVFRQELADAQAGRTAPGVTLAAVRDRPALVRTITGTDDASVTWEEADGSLVWILVTSPAGARPDDVARAVVPLDEATFQALVAAHPVPVNPHAGQPVVIPTTTTR